MFSINKKGVKMEITCTQMDVLLSFYIEGDLSISLKKKVEEHLANCATCRAKYNIVKSMFDDLQTKFSDSVEAKYPESRSQYRIFHNNLSAYVDNELSSDESVKIKKYTINNKKARKELEDTYNIRRLMNESFNKTKLESKQDFTKKVIKQLNLEDDYNYTIHPIIKIGVAFVLTVLVLSAIVLFILTL